MADGLASSSARYVALAEWLASWAWPVDEEGAKALPEAHGWTLVHQKPAGGGVFDTGLTDQRSWASFRVSDDELRDVSIRTAFYETPGPDATRALNDAFADQVEAVVQVLGEPRVRRPGASGSALWDLPNGAMLYVGRTDQSCSWEFTSPAYAEVQRDLGR